MILGFVAGGIFTVAAQSFGVSYTVEMQYVPIEGKANLCNKLRADFSMPVCPGGEFRAATIHIYKANPQRVIDDLMIFSNIEEQNNPLAIAMLGYTQQVGSSSFFLGVRNMNEDYFASPVTSFFTNSSCGIFPTISTNYSIANYPLSALCMHYEGQFGQWGLKSDLYSGVGYNGWSRSDNPFIIDLEKDGVFGITEMSYQANTGSYYCGASLHNRLFLSDEYAEQSDEAIRVPRQKSITWWGYAEQRLLLRGRNEINLLIQYSENSLADNFCKRYAGLGATWLHVSGGQRSHEAGVVFTAAQFSRTCEFATELTYRYQFRPDSYLQPVLHLINNKAGFYSIFMLRFSSAIDWSMKRRG